MTKVFQAPATLTSVGSTADGGLRLNFHTNELTTEEKVTAMGFHQKFGWILFSENQFKQSDVPEEDAPTDEQKTPSQRLRATLYVWWKQQGEPEDFESFYRKWLERAIDRVKRLLD